MGYDNATKTFYLVCEKKIKSSVCTLQKYWVEERIFVLSPFPFYLKRSMKIILSRFTGINTQGLEYSELYKNKKSY